MFKDLTDEELKETHIAIHNEIKRRNPQATVGNVDLVHQNLKPLPYQLRAFDESTKKYVIWRDNAPTLDNVPGKGPFRDLVILQEPKG